MRTISFNLDNIKFNFRVAGIAIHNNKVLFQRGENDNFWALPGGRCELMEQTCDTLKREMFEELQEDVKIIDLKWVAENFFSYDNKNYHEIGFYYIMKFNESSKIINLTDSFKGIEEDAHLIFRWIDISEFDKENIEPKFLKDGIKNIPNSIKHIVVDEIKKRG